METCQPAEITLALTSPSHAHTPPLPHFRPILKKTNTLHQQLSVSHASLKDLR
jgi:hypothetical protein